VATISLVPGVCSSEWDGCETDSESTPLMEVGGVTWDVLGSGAISYAPGEGVVEDVLTVGETWVVLAMGETWLVLVLVTTWLILVVG